MNNMQNAARRAPVAGFTNGAPAGVTARAPLYSDWPVGKQSYAELMALHLALQLEQSITAQFIPVLNPVTDLGGVPLAELDVLKRVFARAPADGSRMMQRATSSEIPAVALKLLGDHLEGMPLPLPAAARRNVGVVQTRNTHIDPAAHVRGAAHDLLLAGSSWMRDVLTSADLHKVAVFSPGVDTSLFKPGAKAGHLGQRFVIFSGGRLAYHKGQDIVIAAVKRFRKRHPETLLLTLWQSPYPEGAGALASTGHTPIAPEFYGTALNVKGWAVANGMPEDAIVDLGVLPPAALAVVLREANVALFPNRAESDANPLLLECMATGVPVIASRNTGHLDVAHAELCYPLVEQGALRGVAPDGGTDGWGEASVDEIVAHLETIHAQQGAARTKAAAAATWAAAFGWDQHVPRLMALLKPLLDQVRG